MEIIKSFNELLKMSKKLNDESKNTKLLIKNLNNIDKKDLKNLTFNPENKYINKFRTEIKNILLHSPINFKQLQKVKNNIIKKAQKDVFKNKSYFELLKPFLFIDIDKKKNNLNIIKHFFSNILNLEFTIEYNDFGWWLESKCNDLEFFIAINYTFPSYGACKDVGGFQVCTDIRYNTDFTKTELAKIINQIKKFKKMCKEVNE